jgi:hypothetical protein
MTMDIRQANTHLSTGAGRGIAKMDGTGKLSNKIALITGCGTQKFHPAPIWQRCWHLFVRLPCARKPEKPAPPDRKHFSAGLTVCDPDSHVSIPSERKALTGFSA